MSIQSKKNDPKFLKLKLGSVKSVDNAYTAYGGL